MHELALALVRVLRVPGTPPDAIRQLLSAYPAAACERTLPAALQPEGTAKHTSAKPSSPAPFGWPATTAAHGGTNARARAHGGSVREPRCRSVWCFWQRWSVSPCLR